MKWLGASAECRINARRLQFLRQRICPATPGAREVRHLADRAVLERFLRLIQGRLRASRLCRTPMRIPLVIRQRISARRIAWISPRLRQLVLAWVSGTSSGLPGLVPGLGDTMHMATSADPVRRFWTISPGRATRQEMDPRELHPGCFRRFGNWRSSGASRQRRPTRTHGAAQAEVVP